MDWWQMNRDLVREGGYVEISAKWFRYPGFVEFMMQETEGLDAD